MEMWDKGRGAGGRMSTSRARGDSGRRADLGAQYLTQHGAEGASWYEQLKNEGVIRSLSGEIRGQHKGSSDFEHYVAPEGIGAIVKAIARGVNLKPGHRVQSLDRVEKPSGGWQWQVTTEANPGGSTTSAAAAGAGSTASSAVAEKHLFDGVVLTIPAPQVLQLKGTVQSILEESGAAAALGGVKYSSRYALAMWWPATEAEALAAAIPWVGRYVEREACSDIRYLSFEPRKRQLLHAVREGEAVGGSGRETLREGADPPTLVAHTGIGFGERRLDDDLEAVGAELVGQVRALLPALPEPAEVRCHRWRFSQVVVNAPAAAAAAGVAVTAGGSGGVDQSPRAAWVVSRDPLLVIAGDSLTESNLDGCIATGEAAAGAVAAAIAGRA